MKQQNCPYCHQPSVDVQKCGEDFHAMQCHHCGARGPVTRLSQSPTILPEIESGSLLSRIFDESPNILMLKDWEDNFLLCNKTFADLYGTTPAEMVGKTDADFNPNQEQVDAYLQDVREVIKNGKVKVVWEESTDANTGETRYFQSIKKPLKGPNGEDWVLIISNDVSELQKAYLKIEESEKTYNYVMNASSSGMWDWNIVTGEVRHNLKWCEILGFDDQMLVHDMSILTTVVHPEDQDAMMEKVSSSLSSGQSYVSEHRMLRPDGSEVWVYDRGQVVEYEDGKPTRMVGSMADITQRKIFELEIEKTSRALASVNSNLENLVNERTKELTGAVRELENLATQDQLTGVGNRVKLERWFASQDDMKTFVTVLIDLDRFKSVNDRFGHDLGDKVLAKAAQCFAGNIRSSDLLIRWGGEEFLIVFPSISVEQAYTIAEKLRQSLQDARILPNDEPVTASLGICSAPVNKTQFNSAVLESDRALYRAKHAGRNCVQIYSNS